MRGKKIVLTEEQEKYLVKHFKHKKNEELAEKLGISWRSVVRQARAMGLKKSTQFMHKCQREMIEKANESNRINGTYPPKGYHIPNSEKYRFKKGETPEDRIGKKREQERIKKSVASRKQTWEKETWRAVTGWAYGMPQQTKMKVLQQPKEKIEMRSYLYKRGYVLDDEEGIAYYDNLTKRGRIIEQKRQDFYKFMPLRIANNI